MHKIEEKCNLSHRHSTNDAWFNTVHVHPFTLKMFFQQPILIKTNNCRRQHWTERFKYQQLRNTFVQKRTNPLTSHTFYWTLSDELFCYENFVFIERKNVLINKIKTKYVPLRLGNSSFPKKNLNPEKIETNYYLLATISPCPFCVNYDDIGQNMSPDFF